MATNKEVKETKEAPPTADQLSEETVSEESRFVLYQYDRDTLLTARVIAEYENDVLDLGGRANIIRSRLPQPDGTMTFLKVRKGSKGQVGTWRKIEL